MEQLILDGHNCFSSTTVSAQLQAFANGTRYNDISGQMRNVARNVTPAEMADAAPSRCPGKHA
jgi:hypothetical protein